MLKVKEEREYREWSELTEAEKDRNRYYGNSSLESHLFIECHDAIEYLFRERLNAGHLPDLELHWSLNHSQGDGCSATGTVNVTRELLEAVKDYSPKKFNHLRRLLADGDAYVTYTIRRYTDHYCHPYTLHIDVESTDLPDTVDEDIASLGDDILKHLRQICHDVEIDGYKVIDDIFSDDNIAAICEDNGVLFDKRGNIYWHLLDMIQDNENGIFSDVRPVKPCQQGENA